MIEFRADANKEECINPISKKDGGKSIWIAGAERPKPALSARPYARHGRFSNVTTLVVSPDWKDAGGPTGSLSVRPP